MKEPKSMKELHKIREKMSKLSREELLKELAKTREKYKYIISAGELKAKKKQIKVKDVFGMLKDWKRSTQEIKDEARKGWE